eukprot:gnl/Carplike_NY0171/2699_a3626_505.p1 GENE.gnl/Carplike_NY0171/2699_a3626_505~~gnl/Carplike_NY0171/2699_a3626_505.p1  ORF type:complete len:803 (-),score=262.90 gnl/Carplike_NY0171/2699_a3626_505:19-2427(-)
MLQKQEKEKRKDQIEGRYILSFKNWEFIKKSQKKAEKEAQNLHDIQTSLESEIVKTVKAIESAEQHASFKAQEFSQWQQAELLKREDVTALESYKHADEKKIRELSVKTEKINKEISAIRTVRDEVVAQTQSLQQQMVRQSQKMINIDSSKNEWIDRIQKSEAVFLDKERDLQDISRDIEDSRATTTHREQELKKEEDHLESEETLKAEIIKQRDASRRSYEAKREDVNSWETQVSDGKDTLNVSHRVLEKISKELDSFRNQVKTVDQKITDTEHRVEVSKKKLKETEDLQKDMEKEKHNKVLYAKRAEEAAQRLLSEKEEKQQQLKQLEEITRTTIHEVQALRESESKDIAQIGAGKVSIRNLKEKIQQLDKHLQQQTFHLYNSGYRVQQLERRLSRAQGARSEEETRALKKRIEELTTAFNKEEKRRKLLADQESEVTRQNQRAVRQLNQLKVDEEKISAECTAKELEADKLEKKCGKLKKDCEDSYIDQSEVSLKDVKLRDELNRLKDTEARLTNIVQHRKALMMGKRVEIESLERGSLAELRLISEENTKTKSEVHKRRVLAQKLKAKYEVISGKQIALAKHMGVGSEVSATSAQALVIVNVEKKKQELKEKGDALNKQIIKEEVQCEELQRVVDTIYMTVRNSRDGMKQVDPSSELYSEYISKTEEKRAIDSSLRHAQQEIRELTQEQSFRLEEKSKLNGETDDLGVIVEDLDEEKTNIEKDVIEKEQMIRATRSSVYSLAGECGFIEADASGDRIVLPPRIRTEESVRVLNFIKEQLQEIMVQDDGFKEEWMKEEE